MTGPRVDVHVPGVEIVPGQTADKTKHDGPRARWSLATLPLLSNSILPYFSTKSFHQPPAGELSSSPVAVSLVLGPDPVFRLLALDVLLSRDAFVSPLTVGCPVDVPS